MANKYVTPQPKAAASNDSPVDGGLPPAVRISAATSSTTP